jgi:hypothetical protein
MTIELAGVIGIQVALAVRRSAAVSFPLDLHSQFEPVLQHDAKSVLEDFRNYQTSMYLKARSTGECLPQYRIDGTFGGAMPLALSVAYLELTTACTQFEAHLTPWDSEQGCILLLSSFCLPQFCLFLRLLSMSRELQRGSLFCKSRLPAVLEDHGPIISQGMRNA